METARKIDKVLCVKQEAGLRGKATRWSNKDLDPVPQAHRTWSALDVCSYWNSDQFAPATWDLGSALVGLGLTLKQAVPISFFAFFCIGVVLSLNGRIGALTHCSFPVCARAPFGMVGAYIPIIVRSILALLWLVILTYQGGNVVAVMLGSIWPSFNRIENTLPEGLGITTQSLVGFLLLWLVQAPLACIPIHKIKIFFSIKAWISIVAFIAFFVWSLVVTKGKGQLISGAMDSSKFPGGSRAWAIISGINTVVGLYSTVSVNISDFSRFSRSPKANHWQILAVPVTGTIPIAIAILCAEAAQQNYGVSIYDPASLCALFDSRAARFFSSFAWVVMTIGVNLSANQLSFATDVTSLMPRYITILRGSIFASILCWATCPWKIVTDAPSFLAFLSAYPVFLAPIATIMFIDFYLVRKERVDVRELYEPQGTYRYTYGVNWRPFLAWILALAPNLPAFAHAIDPSNPDVQPYTYRFSWFFSTFASAILYLAINFFFPPTSSLIEEAVYDISETEFDVGSEEGVEGTSEKKKDSDDLNVAQSGVVAAI
ncbi:uncharacterized protein JCM6883_006035 [Sporobolomyces salmoneus]|uniref:uncharacterized protein n=1 Tax=Sporobolomyces salmoneus TaxID=183962 RepID=UPI003170C34B